MKKYAMLGTPGVTRHAIYLTKAEHKYYITVEDNDPRRKAPQVIDISVSKRGLLFFINSLIKFYKEEVVSCVNQVNT